MDRFYFPGPGDEVRVVSHDSGHIAIVGRTPRQLPAIMHAAALAAGCLREGTVPAPVVAPCYAASPSKPLREVLIAIADAAKPGTVDGEGRPLPDAVREALGIHVSDLEVFSEWANIEQQVVGDEPPPPPIVELTEEQVNKIHVLAQASFRTLQELVPAENDVEVLIQVLKAEDRREEPRETVVKLLEKRLKAMKPPVNE